MDRVEVQHQQPTTHRLEQAQPVQLSPSSNSSSNKNSQRLGARKSNSRRSFPIGGRRAGFASERESSERTRSGRCDLHPHDLDHLVAALLAIQAGACESDAN
jgi:hypothetical protein